MFSRILTGFFNEIISFVLPGVCLCCDEPIETNGLNNNFICPKCYGKLEGFNISHPWKRECINAGVIDDSLSAFWFRDGNEIQSLIHEMKYKKMKSIGKFFGREIGNRINSACVNQWHYVIPVPLHKARLRDRTYNQSEFIAAGIAPVTKSVALADGIIRCRHTGTQTKLNKPQRKENVKDAFRVNRKYKDKLTGKNVIIADDVITTGATILECAQTLKNCGVNKVMVCSAAYAELASD